MNTSRPSSPPVHFTSGATMAQSGMSALAENCFEYFENPSPKVPSSASRACSHARRLVKALRHLQTKPGSAEPASRAHPRTRQLTKAFRHATNRQGLKASSPASRARSRTRQLEKAFRHPKAKPGGAELASRARSRARQLAEPLRHPASKNPKGTQARLTSQLSRATPHEDPRES